jgi:malate dehydrogenase (oxaloacetate-decarboxylating)(NADP+)
MFFDIEIGTKDIEEFIQTVKKYCSYFGGINLEDIKAPSHSKSNAGW